MNLPEYSENTDGDSDKAIEGLTNTNMMQNALPIKRLSAFCFAAEALKAHVA